ncbi:MAG: NAD(+)/NADH kinase [Planctomycetes bacterium]|nr:NAD(+)/NADH kinase [Planctomycetota bacterium]
MKPPTSALLLVDGRDPRSLDEAARIGKWLAARSIKVSRTDLQRGARRVGAADLAIALGGDGTFLRAARALRRAAGPLVGVRLGSFGYLAELEPGDWEDELTRLVEGHGNVEKWLRLRVRVRAPGGRVREFGPVLNEAVVTAARVARLVEFTLRIDGEDVTRFRGDGMIVSTPVGSTAHSLAAGGPIVDRTDRCLLLTPLNSQALTYRPLVLRSSRRVELLVQQARHGTALTIDGQETLEVESGTVIEVTESEQDLHVATVVQRTRFRTLRERLKWGDPLVPGR